MRLFTSVTDIRLNSVSLKSALLLPYEFPFLGEFFVLLLWNIKLRKMKYEPGAKRPFR